MRIIFLLIFSLSLYAEERIIALAPSISEIVFALGKGDEIVGQCGVLCQVELGDLISKKTLLILNGEKKINEL